MWIALATGLFAVLLAQRARTETFCNCIGGGKTNVYTGSGSSCTSADASLFNQAITEANRRCAGSDGGVCGENLVVTTACHKVSSTTYQESGYLSFHCLFCASR
jgi:hypothetical protein